MTTKKINHNLFVIWGTFVLPSRQTFSQTISRLVFDPFQVQCIFKQFNEHLSYSKNETEFAGTNSSAHATCIRYKEQRLMISHLRRNWPQWGLINRRKALSIKEPKFLIIQINNFYYLLSLNTNKIINMWDGRFKMQVLPNNSEVIMKNIAK